MRLVGLRRVGTERQVPTTRQRCCPRRRDRVGWDGVAMVTEPVLQPRSQDVPPKGVPRSFPGDSSPRGNGSFTIPVKMATTLNHYRRENSKTLGFLQDRVVLHRSLDTGNMPGVEGVNGDVGHVFCDELK